MRGAVMTIRCCPARHRASTARANSGRPGTPSCRNTTPHPGGSARTDPNTSGVRAASVNSQITGPSTRDRDLTARAHDTSLGSMVSPLLDRYAALQARIAAAAAQAGRPPPKLIAVSKTYPADDVLTLLQAGHLEFGENRVQEAAAKFIPLRAAHPQLRLHLIGGLQTNKARDAVRLADVIEVLDRPRLLDALVQAQDQNGQRPHYLIQVNVGDEPQKAGISTADADAFIGQCQARLGSAVTGLMCIPPADVAPGPHFAWLAAAAARHGLHVLSMGMSADFETAIAHGATHIRIGSALFGARTAPPLLP